MITKRQKTILHLSLLRGVGHALVQYVVQKIGLDDIERVYGLGVDQLVALGCRADKAEGLVRALQDRSALEQELELLREHPEIKVILWGDDEYPVFLKTISFPPLVLYVQGSVLCLSVQKRVAFVGARKAGAYAQSCVQALARPLAQAGVVLVSGGAYGVDTFTHQVAVSMQQPTIAVLGSGLLRWYPSANKKLFESIVQTGGALVSCFPLTMEPFAANFPARNRIIAGLAQGVVVVQAAVKSGALITAEFALDQGKEVFAVPGSMHDELSAGCHELIRQGAILVTSAQYICTALSYENHKSLQTPLFIQDIQPVKQESYAPGTLEEKVFWYAKKPISTDDLLNLVGVVPEELTSILFTMSLEGKIAQDMLGLWCLR